MSCTRPLKAFKLGLNSNGKDDLVITNYKVNHIEIDKNGNVVKCYNSTISQNCYRTISTYQELNCGSCLGCKLDHAKMWSERIALEMKKYDDNCFITLTYSDDNLPKSYTKHFDDNTGELYMCKDGNYNTLCKKDLQNFFKRLRKNTGKKLRYFACGEYGSTTKRPHYHIICFGFKPSDLVLYSKSSLGDLLYNSPTIDKAWQYKGFCVVGEATKESAQYVARYTAKKVNDDYKDFYKEFGITPEFIVMSRKPGIGRDYYETNKTNSEFLETPIVLSTLKGMTKFKPSKYYKQLYKEEYPEEYERVKQKNIKLINDYKEMKLKNTDKDYLSMLADEELSLKERTKILKERSKV